MDMNFLRSIQWTPLTILKAAGIIFVSLVLLSLALAILGSIVRPLAQNFGPAVNGVMPQAMSAPGYAGYGSGVWHDESASYGEKGPVLSTRNAASSMPQPPMGNTVGNDAEEYEVSDYNVSIETHSKTKTCGVIAGWKAYEYVVFENASEYERGCNYSFKVAHAHVDETLAALKALKPRELAENTYTIQRQVEDFTSQEEILQKQLESIDGTLESAITAYDEVTVLATRTQNADSLAKIIDSRINVIERLTQQRIDTAAQLERLARAKAEQLDKLDYIYFFVTVYESKLFDGREITDSWKEALQGFVREANHTLQQLTVGLIALVLAVVQYVIYLLILLFVAKYLWRAAVYIWKR